MIAEAPVDQDDAAVLRELEAQWEAIKAGNEPLIPHDEVRKWLLTWGTDAYRPWSDRR